MRSINHIIVAIDAEINPLIESVADLDRLKAVTYLDKL